MDLAYDGTNTDYAGHRASNPPTSKDHAVALVLAETAFAQFSHATRNGRFDDDSSSELIASVDFYLRLQHARRPLPTAQIDMPAPQWLGAINDKLNTLVAGLETVTTSIGDIKRDMDQLKRDTHQLKQGQVENKSLAIRGIQLATRISNRSKGLGGGNVPYDSVITLKGQDPVEDLHLPALRSGSDIQNLSTEHRRSYMREYGFARTGRGVWSDAEKHQANCQIAEFIGACLPINPLE